MQVRLWIAAILVVTTSAPGLAQLSAQPLTPYPLPASVLRHGAGACRAIRRPRSGRNPWNSGGAVGCGSAPRAACETRIPGTGSGSSCRAACRSDGLGQRRNNKGAELLRPSVGRRSRQCGSIEPDPHRTISTLSLEIDLFRWKDSGIESRRGRKCTGRLRLALRARSHGRFEHATRCPHGGEPH